MRSGFAVLFLVLSLAACQTVPGEPGPFDDAAAARQRLATLAVADLAAAKADADAHDDVIASQCWAALIPIAERARDTGPPVGAASALQRVRDTRRTIEDEKLHAACSALVMDAQAVIVRLARLLGLTL